MSPEELSAKMEHQLTLMESGLSPEEAAERAGIDTSMMHRRQPANPMDGAQTTEALKGVFGKLAADGAEGIVGGGDLDNFRKAAERIGADQDKYRNKTPPPGEPKPPE